MGSLSTKEARRAVRGRPRDAALDGAILDATEQALASRGYEAMTMGQVAAAAGVSKPTIYLRYRSKADLVAAMIDRLEPPLPATTGTSARDDLVDLVRMGQRWVDRHGLRLVAAVILEQADHPELMDRFRQRAVDPVRDAFERALAAGVARGELRRDAVDDEIVDALAGAYWARSWAKRPAPRGWAGRLVDGILRGLLATAE
ncbi:MAG TPA: TetR/AcrR family transcriptional regulator [Acidimicrobiales bacterium]|nr:TetR/AcrR family transcriptional regulator [Acidimicrobiales bacterium]